ncbi:TIGR02678 family protein [Geobacillus sp. FSL K6-0789]|uniref:TIGR02678 family protein n=4 Tax=Bacillales TaxID=1385 RepID=A0A0K9HMU8_GEOSE|nr:MULTISPECIES: TIGR02678 family protein [Geobacillus]KAF6509416.1 hypothetical protein GS8_3244 [Geobacillus stearothermophilus]KMY56543.1 cytosolic protein [Geobacillus stearothermophilus]KMY60193.1 cytosolic protein [Geobacillus stearothermophilus]KMY65013.1 cytosolic protein [Geobacillus stearothermophilus]KOR93269.1 cytosolic protein [Geobacillus stearothermophilus ATCC 12980]
METAFDDKAKEALAALFEQFWIIRDQEPDLYQLVREREHVLKRYVEEKFGYRLIVHRYFAKLEKIPADPEPWMGIESFQEPLDYALFCCLMAYLEGKAVEDKFLLSDVCEEIRAMYPGDLPVDWTNYAHRRALIRVLKTAEQIGLVRRMDGEIEAFAQHVEEEALYEVPVLARYFMRTHPKDLLQYESIDELLAEEWKASPQDYRRHRLYRKLFLSPAVHRTEGDEQDFYYLRNFRHRLRDDIEAHTPFRYELYKNAAMLMLPERQAPYTVFPDQKGTSEIILHFAALVRERLGEYPPDEYGRIRLTSEQFSAWLADCRRRYGAGWGKTYRDMSAAELVREVLAALNEWRMADVEHDTGMIVLYPLLGRVSGRYPDDFDAKEGGEHGESMGASSCGAD